jgi:type IV pilus assembly protein PilB
MAGPAGRGGLQAPLLTSGCVNGNDLAVAQQAATRDRRRLADAIVALGRMPESDVYAVVAQAAGVDYVDLRTHAANELAIRLVPERLARRHQIVPVSVDNQALTYTTCKPYDDDAEGDLAFASGRRTRFVVSSRTDLVAAIERCYPQMRELDVIANRLRSEGPSVENTDTDVSGHSESAVIELCNHIIGRAVEVHAVFRRSKVAAA